MWPVGGEGLVGFGCCHGCVVLVLVWQVTSGKNLRRIDLMCVKSRITEAEGGKWTGCSILPLPRESAFVLCENTMSCKY